MEQTTNGPESRPPADLEQRLATMEAALTAAQNQPARTPQHWLNECATLLREARQVLETERRHRTLPETGLAPESESDVTAAGRDVSEQRHVEQELQILADNVPALLSYVDAEGRYRYVNRRYEEWFRRPRRQIIGRQVREIIGDEAYEGVRERLRLALSGQPVRFEGLVPYAAGGARWVQTEYVPDIAADGSVRGLFVLVLDLTERKRMETALRESEERYRSLVQSARDSIVTVSPNGEITSVNRTVEELSGWPASEWLDQRFDALIHPQDQPKAREHFARALQGEQLPIIEIRARNRHGEYRWVECATAPQIRDGAVESLLVIARDISERKALEEQLRQSQKLEAVGRLAGGIAHDFNNMLTIILSYAEMALHDLAPHDPLREAIGNIHLAAERSRGLTRQLLLFSRQELLEPVTVDLNEVVGEMQRLLRRVIGVNIELVTDTAATPQWIKADPGQIEQVILNLALNARDAMPQGGRLLLEVRAAEPTVPLPASRNTESVLLAVSDTGCGMDADVKAHLFEPFFTTKPPGQGTGLGLPVVYGIVRQSEGLIQVTSEPDQGARFEIYFPRADAPTSRPDTIANGHRVVPGAATILLAEDEDTVRSLTERVLTECGYTVLPARNAEEALQTCARHDGPIHLLLTDVVMPQMNGCELADRVAERWPGIKVLYMSGYADDATVRQRILQGSHPFMPKPFQPVALRRKVAELLAEAEIGHG